MAPEHRPHGGDRRGGRCPEPLDHFHHNSAADCAAGPPGRRQWATVPNPLTLAVIFGSLAIVGLSAILLAIMLVNLATALGLLLIEMPLWSRRSHQPPG